MAHERKFRLTAGGRVRLRSPDCADPREFDEAYMWPSWAYMDDLDELVRREAGGDPFRERMLSPGAVYPSRSRRSRR
jgi:hypothetical protein